MCSHPPRLSPTTRPVLVDETQDWLVVDKPALMAAHPSKPGDASTLWHYLCELLAFERINGGQVSLINRLDRETSGLTLVAKTREAARNLCRLMERHRIHKGYTALVFGWPKADAWEVDAPLARQGAHGPSRIWLKQCIHPQGSPAVTRFQVTHRLTLERAGRHLRVAVVQATPLTGRMHQIRVHASSSGHPLVGDKIYGEDEGCYLEFIETGWTPSLAERLLLPRHALHAGELAIPELELLWRAPLPPDMADFERALEEPPPARALTPHA